MANTILGTAGNDTLTGTAGVADLINGLDGNDDLSSGEATAGKPGDTLDGGLGNDTLTGGAGTDSLLGGAGNDLLLSWLGGADTLDGGDGNDQLFAGSGVVMRGGLGNDALYGQSNNTLDGGDGNDGLKVDGNNNSLLGGNGNDNIFSNGSSNVLDGGAGDDQIVTNNSTNDTLIGGTGIDSLVADLGGNHFRISLHTVLDNVTVNDTTAAVAGVVELATGLTAANIQMLLKGRNLQLSWNGGQDGVTINNYVQQDLLTVRPFAIQLAGGQQLNTSAAVNAVRMASTTGNDGLIGDATANAIYGDLGNDTIRGEGGDDVVEGQLGNDVLYGGAGNDTLRGGWNDDVLYGDAGLDQLEGGQGADTLYGGDGNDTLLGGSGDDVLDSGIGTNLLNGGAGNDTLIGGTGANNTYIGGEGDDLITVDAGVGGTFTMGLYTGNDTVNLNQNVTTTGTPLSVLKLDAGVLPANVGIQFTPGQEKVFIIGGSSSATFNVGTTHLDQLVFSDGTTWNRTTIVQRSQLSSAGNDVIYNNAASVTLQGGAGNDSLYALGGDTLDGGAGDDWLEQPTSVTTATSFIGGAGRDTLTGSDGNDTLAGGTGDDSMLGGLGKDTYLFNIGDGHDTIADYDWLAASDRTTINAGVVVKLGAGMTSSNIVLRRTEDSLLIMPGTGTDLLEIYNYYVALPTTTWLFFSDGSSMTNTTIQTKATNVTGISADLAGTAGNDSLSAGYSSAYSTITGAAGNDTLDAGTFNGTLVGGTGNDTYQWGLNGGNITITDTADVVGATSADVLVLGAGITTSMVTLTPSYDSTSNPLGWLLTVAGQGGSVTVTGGTSATPVSGQPSIRFADGTVWNQATILDKLRKADPAGATWLLGGSDTLTAGNGLYKTAYGGAGADTYVVGRSNAIQDIVPATTAFNEHPSFSQQTPGHSPLFDGSPAPAATDVDTLKLTDGIKPQEVMAHTAPGYNTTLQLGLRDTNFQLTLEGYLASNTTATSEVDNVVFDDGTVWSRADLIDLASHYSDNGLNLLGGITNDKVNGEDGTDWLGGGAGNDTLTGNAGGDTMVGGAGNDTYYVDDSADVVTEQAGATQGTKDTIYTSVNYTVSDNVETLVLTGADNLNATGRATVGTALIGNTGNNVLTGGSGGDTLNGGLGNDTLAGGNDGDFYYMVDETDTVSEQASDTGLDVEIQLTDNLTMADNVEYLFMKTNTGYYAKGNVIENWIYGNGVGCYLDGGAGDDHIFGKGGEDVLIGGLGDDELNGGAGNDLYTMQLGDGFDAITDFDATAGNTDQLDIQGVQTNQLWLTQVGNDLAIQVLGTFDGASIANWFSGSANQIEQITAGGKTLSNSRVQALVQAMAGITPPAAGITTLSATDQTKVNNALTVAWQP